MSLLSSGQVGCLLQLINNNGFQTQPELINLGGPKNLKTRTFITDFEQLKQDYRGLCAHQSWVVASGWL